jgi:hypothetical protein
MAEEAYQPLVSDKVSNQDEQTVCSLLNLCSCSSLAKNVPLFLLAVVTGS